MNKAKMTQEERREFINQFVDIVVDDMTLQDLVEFVKETLTDEYHLMPDSELYCTVENMYDEALCDALYDRATSEWSLANYC